MQHRKNSEIHNVCKYIASYGIQTVTGNILVHICSHITPCDPPLLSPQPSNVGQVSPPRHAHGKAWAALRKSGPCFLQAVDFTMASGTRIGLQDGPDGAVHGGTDLLMMVAKSPFARTQGISLQGIPFKTPSCESSDGIPWHLHIGLIFLHTKKSSHRI